MWIDFRALNGLIFDPSVPDENGDASLRKMPVGEFAKKIGVDRTTLYAWQSSIPNFWEKVNSRRTELAPQSRLAKLHETWYLKALTVKNWPVTEAWLINFDPNYKQPRQKVEHDIGSGLADLINAKRKSQIAERTIIDVTESSTDAPAV